MIGWADAIFLMERKHLDIIKQRFIFDDQTLVVLNIEDNYQFGNAELIEVLKVNLAEYL